MNGEVERGRCEAAANLRGGPGTHGGRRGGRRCAASSDPEEDDAPMSSPTPSGPSTTTAVEDCGRAWLFPNSRWWAPSKFDPTQSPMLFFEKGMPIIPPLLPPEGLDLALKHMITYVNKAMRPNGVKFFRTQSPGHFEGGDWNEGGSCQRDQPLSSEEVKEIFSVDNNGTNTEVRLVNQHLMKALDQSTFRVLDVTHMSEFRADAHPATTGGKKHDDCMHWCLPHGTIC